MSPSQSPSPSTKDLLDQAFSGTHCSWFNKHCAEFGEGNGTPLQYSCLENPMDGGAWKAAVHGVAEGRIRLSAFTFTFHLHAWGEGNGNPLQCSCLENPRDGGAWWAAVYGVAQSQTRLKRLSSSSSSIVDLQCCVSFRCTAKGLSYINIYICNT